MTDMGNDTPYSPMEDNFPPIPDASEEKVLFTITTSAEADATYRAEVAKIDGEQFPVIKDDLGLSVTVERVKQLKRTEKNIIEFFKLSKQQADAAHKSIVAMEKAMLAPVKETIARGNQAVINYNNEQRRKAEEAARRAAEAAEAEKKRLIEEAAALEKENPQAAEQLLEEAVIVESLPAPVVAPMAKPQGLSTAKKLIITVADPKQVPAYFNGMEIRKVDESALRALYKLDPNIKIPGVIFSTGETMRYRT